MDLAGLHVYMLPDDIDNQVSEAIIFSTQPLDEQRIARLRHAQTVVESQWLGAFACYIIPLEAAADGGLTSPSGFEVLYDDVHIISPDEWEATIDVAEAFLMNRRMFELCKDDQATFVGADGTSDHLHDLFDGNMFAVAGVLIDGSAKAV